MAEIGDDDNQFQGRQQLYKQQFKQDFTPRLNEILASGHDRMLLESEVMETVEDLTRTATWYGRIHITLEFPYRRTYIGYGPHRPQYTRNRIAQQRSFIQLLRESGPGTEVRRRLGNVRDQVTVVGEKVSKYLMQMMVVTNIENRDDMMKHFRDNAQTMLSFLNVAFVWEGRTADFGVVFKRINVLIRHAHKEFILHVKRAEMAGGEVGYIEDLKLTFNHKINRDSLLEYIFREIVRVISILESLLSFPLLPDMPRLLNTFVRSISWLTLEVKKLGETMNQRLAFRVETLKLEYERHQNFNDADAVLTRVQESSKRMELWEDLERVAKVRESRSTGLIRIRLPVEGTIIQQHQNNALIRIEGINSRTEAEWYVGKVIFYFYKANVRRNGSHYRSIRGRITAPHEDNGILSAEFRSVLPTLLFDRRRQGPNRLVRLKVYMYRAKINYVFGEIFIGD